MVPTGLGQITVTRDSSVWRVRARYQGSHMEVWRHRLPVRERWDGKAHERRLLASPVQPSPHGMPAQPDWFSWPKYCLPADVDRWFGSQGNLPD